MATLAGLPYVELIFKKDGSRATAGPIRPAGVTDLIIISHGWHQDPGSADGMYKKMFDQLKAAAVHPLPAGRTLGVTGVFWPSDKFKDNLSPETVAVLPGGAAAMGGGDADLAELQARAKALAPLFGMTKATLSNLVTYAANESQPGPDADDLVAALRKKVGPAAQVDAEMQSEHAEMLDKSIGGREIIATLQTAGLRGTAAAAAGGAQAAAMGVSAGGSPALGFLSGPIAAVATLLNQFAYFELKKRAGKIGAALANLLDDDGLADLQRLHLVGHSFGARLMTSASSAIKTSKLYSLTMLQGAFSHNALGVDIKPGMNGAYRNVIDAAKVSGRIVITHTWNDQAVGVFYAIASRASNDIAAGLVRVTDAFGGANDIHGGMGANGALRLKAGEGTEQTFDGLAQPNLGPGVSSLKCDFIKSHTDIETAGVGRVLLAAIR